jgi:hypothetical protein
MRNYMPELPPHAMIPIDLENPCNESAIYSFLVKSVSEKFG